MSTNACGVSGRWVLAQCWGDMAGLVDGRFLSTDARERARQVWAMHVLEKFI